MMILRRHSIVAAILASLVVAGIVYAAGSYDSSGYLRVNVATQTAPATLPLPAGAATAAKQPALGTAGTASADVITVQGIAAGTVLPTSLRASAVSGDGATPLRVANCNATASTIKASAGQLYGLHILNNQAAITYVQVFNATAPTVGTTNPVLEIMVAASAHLSVSLPSVGVAYTTAITVACTTTENGATGSSAGVFVFANYL